MANHLCALVEDRFEKLLESSFSRDSPRSGETSPHMLVTRTTFFRVVSPQSSRNILKFRPAIPVNRLSEIR